MDSARLSTSKGALPWRLSTVRGQESVTQKKANGPSLPSVSSITSRERHQERWWGFLRSHLGPGGQSAPMTSWGTPHASRTH